MICVFVFLLLHVSCILTCFSHKYWLFVHLLFFLWMLYFFFACNYLFSAAWVSNFPTYPLKNILFVLSCLFWECVWFFFFLCWTYCPLSTANRLILISCIQYIFMDISLTPGLIHIRFLIPLLCHSFVFYIYLLNVTLTWLFQVLCAYFGQCPLSPLLSPAVFVWQADVTVHWLIAVIQQHV